MAFEWSEINVGDIIKKTHIIELRDNIDFIKDNLACVTDKTDYKSGYDTSVDSGYKSGYKNGYNTSVLNDHHGTYKSGQNGTYKSDYESSYHNGDHITEKSGYCSSHFNGENDHYNSSN